MPIFDRQTITDYENIDSDISCYQPRATTPPTRETKRE